MLSRVGWEWARKPEIDTSNHYCTNEGCACHECLDRANIVSHEHPPTRGARDTVWTECLIAVSQLESVCDAIVGTPANQHLS
jgi:hypothetical protein